MSKPALSDSGNAGCHITLYGINCKNNYFISRRTLFNAALIMIQQLTEPLEMHYFALAQEAYHFVDVLIVG